MYHDNRPNILSLVFFFFHLFLLAKAVQSDKTRGTTAGFRSGHEPSTPVHVNVGPRTLRCLAGAAIVSEQQCFHKTLPCHA